MSAFESATGGRTPSGADEIDRLGPSLRRELSRRLEARAIPPGVPETTPRTPAAVRLAQGVGRLIRTASDKGVVAVLDSRLETARGYGSFLRRSLPPFWYTTKPDVVESVLRRLAGGGIPAQAAPPA